MSVLQILSASVLVWRVGVILSTRGSTYRKGLKKSLACLTLGKKGNPKQLVGAVYNATRGLHCYWVKVSTSGENTPENSGTDSRSAWGKYLCTFYISFTTTEKARWLGMVSRTLSILAFRGRGQVYGHESEASQAIKLRSCLKEKK